MSVWLRADGLLVVDRQGAELVPFVQGEATVRLTNPLGSQELHAWVQANALGQEGVNVVSECMPAFGGSPESR